MPNASNTDRVPVRCAGGRVEAVDVTADPGRSSPCRARRPGSGWPPCAPRPPPSAASGSPTFDFAGHAVHGRRHRLHRRGRRRAAPCPPTVGRAVLGRRAGAGVAPAGLGARDTLRLEAALPLHGHELGPGITPLQAGLGWVVGWDKGDFRGRAALARRARRRASPRCSAGCAIEGRRPPRADQAVLRDGTAVGHGHPRQLLTRRSECGIALAFLPPVGRRSATSSPSTSAARRCRPAASSCRSCPSTADRARLRAASGLRSRLQTERGGAGGDRLSARPGPPGAGRSTPGCGRRSRRRCG